MPPALVMMHLTRPRSRRSCKSSPESKVVAGISTTPSLIAASMVSHKGTSLPIINKIRSPLRAPRATSQLATWLERCDNSA